MMSNGSVRVDRWIWSIRLCKTRSDATEMCRGGHVRVNGRVAKAASTVSVGDRVEVHVHGRERIVEVTQAINTRVSAPLAAECYVDHSPPTPPRDDTFVARRDAGAGRPTKRERRQLDRWRTSR